MAKFKFRLATLLRLREETRDQRRAELAEAYHADDLLQQHIQEADDALAELLAQCRKVAGPGVVDIDRLVAAGRYELTLRAQRKEMVEQRERVLAEIERRRQALVEANREVRVLEKLRENQTRRHRDEQNRQEVKRLDEVAGRTKVTEEVS
ncbi:MAG TPA: flagellar export protein FliJ [Thermoguttaceae bacterium]|nr:flagellar export protein FliJ [Thermoguttaceae bacterium]